MSRLEIFDVKKWVRMGSKIGCRWVQVYEHAEWSRLSLGASLMEQAVVGCKFMNTRNGGRGPQAG